MTMGWRLLAVFTRTWVSTISCLGLWWPCCRWLLARLGARCRGVLSLLVF